MMYTSHCPRCRKVVGGGHGTPMQHLGTPLKVCPKCGYNYINVHMIEWSIATNKQKIGYLFANNRIWLCTIIPLFAGGIADSIWGGIIAFVIILALCIVYVKAQVSKVIDESYDRTNNPDYVVILKRSGYPVNESNSRNLYPNNFATLPWSLFFMFYLELLVGKIKKALQK